MKYILGTKQYMTQIFSEDGRVTPGTVISASPLTITQIKDSEIDGYSAIQVGAGVQDWKRINKPKQGHLKKANPDLETGLLWLKEIRLPADQVKDLKPGQVIDLSVFAEGDKVQVTGTSKGKGFQGVVKRHNFAGGPRTHGQKHSEREPGSIGGMGIQKVLKGKKMAGRMGSDTVTVKNLSIVKLDQAGGQLMVSGAVPGRPGSLLIIAAK